MTVQTKRPFNKRAFVALATGISGLSLPISGLVLHAYSHHHFLDGKHGWFSAHVFIGIMFTFFAGWHLILNRRPLLGYFKKGKYGWLKINRELFSALAIIIIILIFGSIHSCAG